MKCTSEGSGFKKKDSNLSGGWQKLERHYVSLNIVYVLICGLFSCEYLCLLYSDCEYFFHNQKKLCVYACRSFLSLYFWGFSYAQIFIALQKMLIFQQHTGQTTKNTPRKCLYTAGHSTKSILFITEHQVSTWHPALTDPVIGRISTDQCWLLDRVNSTGLSVTFCCLG